MKAIIIIAIVLVIGLGLIGSLQTLSDIRQQECKADGGVMTGPLGCTTSHSDYAEPKASAEYFKSLGTSYSVQELLSNPNLIRIDKIEEGEGFVHLQSDGNGPEFHCASINVERLSEDKLVEYQQGNKTTRKFISVTDEKLKQVPQLKELIAATHQISIPFNDNSNAYFDGIDFVEYEFFLMDKMIEKYGGTQEDYFIKLDKDYEERLTNPAKQGFSNTFEAPRIIYDGNVYGIGGTVFWTSDEHNLHMSVHLMDKIDEEQKFVSLSDKDMRQIPKIKDAVEKIGIKQESVHAFKSMPEPEWNYYWDWYKEESSSQFDSDKDTGLSVSGFVYDDVHYSLGFVIC